LSMKFKDLIAEIEQIAPRDLEEEWDNCGMQINMGIEEVNRVLVCLDITRGLIDEAKSKNIDFIITHHPLLFNKIDVVDNNTITGNYLIDLIKLGVSVYAAHTTFDEAFGGNNEYLADLIGLSRVRKIKSIRSAARGKSKDHVVGRMGNWKEPCTLEEACKIVEEALDISGETKIVGNPKQMVQSVGICTGNAGDEILSAAMKSGCDLFITGDIKHHEALAAKESGLCMIDAGHFGTEHIFTENFTGKLKKAVGSKIQIFPSEINSNPFKNVI